MDAPSALSNLYFKAQSLAFSECPAPSKQQQAALVSKPKGNSTVTIVSEPETSPIKTNTIAPSPSATLQSPAIPTTSKNDGYSTPKAKEDKKHDKDTMQLKETPSPRFSTSKRKRLDMDDDLSSFIGPTPTKRKGSSEFLRKGQWTSTEEKLAGLLIEAFEDGYLPIYTGIRLRGYLAVQLQCDPMRVSKKLCAGTIDGKPVPKNYGQKKFKLRKKPLWDCEEAECRITELERLTEAMWNEARMEKPSFLTLSTTRNVAKRRDADDEDSVSSPPSPARGRTPSSTPRAKKQKVFPIIYLNLSKKLKHYAYSSSSEPSTPSKDSDSDSEPVRLDGESLQAAYDLLTLCSPRGTSSKRKSKKKTASKKSKKLIPIKDEVISIKDEAANQDTPVKEVSSKATTTNGLQQVFIKDEPAPSS
ncbi:hypothetical protein KRP22_004736 [Phytophthora ramorum]|nr:hypothetical protein KRP22_10369 [Phytophthora ramorum]